MGSGTIFRLTLLRMLGTMEMLQVIGEFTTRSTFTVQTTSEDSAAIMNPTLSNTRSNLKSITTSINLDSAI